MKYSEKALANGWGWVLGVSGEECRVYRERPSASDQILAQTARHLGVEDIALVPAVVRQLQQDRKQALTSAVTAWDTVHALITDNRAGERDGQ
ncbi:hypothetical protein AB0B15_10475 [Streptomyces sp. NPDC045456]|uniref:hypothetical protein n=1 Tax=Streptomyces sp. NPDC045456 TaxID=3155254 RepID=UPI0033F7F7B0